MSSNNTNILDITLDDGIKSIVERMNLHKKMIIPLTLVKDPIKFINHVISKDKTFVIIVPNDHEIVRKITEMRKNSAKYIFISEKIMDYIIVMY